jgi:hypothetical protein
MNEAYQSKVEYAVGTIIYDEETGEVFEVVSCERIGVVEEFNYGVTIKEVRGLQ